MAIIDTLKAKYPDAIPGVDYFLQNDGDGDYIKVWNLDSSQPTAEDLEASEGQCVLNTARESAWSEIKAERDSRTQLGGCLVGTEWFHTDTFSRSQWLGLKDQARDILAASGVMTDPIKKLGSQVQWKTMGGTFAAVTVQLAFDVTGATGDSDAQVFLQAEIHHAAMLASADPSAYDFSKGWPVNFQG